MTRWSEFAAGAPRISEIFERRHAATGNLCFLATVRADGSPRISPMEPRIFDGELWLVGMPDTTKFRDLARDPRFSLHTANADPQVPEGDAKVWGTVRDVQDAARQRRFAEDLFEEKGLDLRDERFDPFYAADLSGASSLEVRGDHLEITVWRPGEGERVVEKW
jgi:hypothetical protein